MAAHDEVIKGNDRLPKAENKKRIGSIDIFRGIAIAMMLFMENPGNPKHVSSQLVHAPWNGLTLADLGFPFFIFIAGSVIPVSLNKRIERGDPKLKIYVHLLYRSTVIFLTGLFLNGFPDFNLSVIRIMGPLQRIAIVYLIAGALVLETNILIEAIIAFSIPIVYFILMKCIYVPGYGAGVLNMNGNLAQYIDIHILKNHMYTPTWEPEGIMGTLPAISTILSGVIAGQIILSDKIGKYKKFMILIIAGVVCMLLGKLSGRWFPINKNLWSTSFVLYTSGIAFTIISVLYFIVDIVGYSAAFQPLKILGSSPLFVYVGFELVRRTLWVIPVQDRISGASLPLYMWLCNKFVTPWAGNINDSYYFSALYTLLWAFIVWVVKKKGLSVKNHPS